MDLSTVSRALDAARTTDPDAYRMAGKAPRLAVRPADELEVAEVLRVASSEGLKVVPWGGGVSLSRERAPSQYDIALDLRALARITRFERDDFTLTAQAGVTLADLRAEVERVGLELPLEAAEAWGATLGGVLAADVSGPRRRRFGAPRDRILGARFATSDGTIARAGGQVVKNVAGLAVHRLLCGSRGGLAVLLEASLKLRPAPVARIALVHGLSSAEVADPDRWHDWLRREPSALTVVGREVAATLPTLSSAADFAVVSVFEDDPAWIPSQDAFARERLGSPRYKVQDGAVAPLLQHLNDLEEMPGTRLTFTTASGSPDALAPLLADAAACRVVFHAPAGRLHVWPSPSCAASLVELLARHGFALLETRDAGSLPPGAPAPGIHMLRTRLRAALDPARTMALGDSWENRT